MLRSRVASRTVDTDCLPSDTNRAYFGRTTCRQLLASVFRSPCHMVNWTICEAIHGAVSKFPPPVQTISLPDRFTIYCLFVPFSLADTVKAQLCKSDCSLNYKAHQFSTFWLLISTLVQLIVHFTTRSLAWPQKVQVCSLWLLEKKITILFTQ